MTDLPSSKGLSDSLATSSDERMVSWRSVRMLAHDLRTALSGTHALAQLISLDIEESRTELSSHLEQLNGSITSLLQLLQGMVSNLAGPTVCDYSNVRIIDIIKEVIKLINPPPPTIVLIPNVLPSLKTDKVIISRIILNLISNSLRYGDKKYPVIEINGQESDTEVWITIQDNGPGMPAWAIDQLVPADRNKPQNKFLKAVAYREKRQHGSGLGLHIIREGVAKLGGEISVETIPRRGTRFLLRLPKGANHNAAKEPSGKPE